MWLLKVEHNQELMGGMQNDGGTLIITSSRLIPKDSDPRKRHGYCSQLCILSFIRFCKTNTYLAVQIN
jgi:hypothetical protein